MTATTPIPGLNKSVVEAAERTRLASYLTKLKAGQPFASAERADFDALFAKYMDDAPEVEAPPVLGMTETTELMAKANVNPGPKAPKANKHERAVMVEQVMLWWVDGWQRLKVVREVAIRWGKGERTADQLIRLAKDELLKRANEGRRALKVVATIRLDEAFTLARTAGDPNAMVNAVKAFSALHGLDEPKVVHTEGDLDLTSGGLPIKAVLSLPDDGSGVTS